MFPMSSENFLKLTNTRPHANNQENILILGVCDVMDPKKGHLCFAESTYHLEQLHCNMPISIVTTSTLLHKTKHLKTQHIFISSDVRKNMIHILQEIQKFEMRKYQQHIRFMPTMVEPNANIMQGSFVDGNCHIAKNVIIEPNVVIGHSSHVGENSRIHAGVVLYPNTKIGANCIIHSNTSLGLDGFGFYSMQEQQYKIPHIGNVEIGDNVEIGSCCSVQRGTLRSTKIGNGCKLDSQTHIAHNCILGDNTMILAQSGLAGSVLTCKNVKIAGHNCILPKVTLGESSIVWSKSLVKNSIKKKQIVFGIPAKPTHIMHKILASFPLLPKYLNKIRKLELMLTKLYAKKISSSNS